MTAEGMDKGMDISECGNRPAGGRGRRWVGERKTWTNEGLSVVSCVAWHGDGS